MATDNVRTGAIGGEGLRGDDDRGEGKSGAESLGASAYDGFGGVGGETYWRIGDYNGWGAGDEGLTVDDVVG